MSDVVQVIATGSFGIVGAVIGAGMAYWFGARTRKHQEDREDQTRWYEARFRAYAEFSQVVADSLAVLRGHGNEEEIAQLGSRLDLCVGQISLVGSQEVELSVMHVAKLFLDVLRTNKLVDEREVAKEMALFHTYARKDLGHPEPKSSRTR